MLSYWVLFINKTLCIADEFSGILTNLPEPKLTIIKLDNLNKNFDNLRPVFQKRIFCSKARKWASSSDSANLNKTTIIFITFWGFLMFYRLFFSLQVKQCAIISYKNGVYELPHELPNDVRLRRLGN